MKIVQYHDLAQGTQNFCLRSQTKWARRYEQQTIMQQIGENSKLKTYPPYSHPATQHSCPNILPNTSGVVVVGVVRNWPERIIWPSQLKAV